MMFILQQLNRYTDYALLQIYMEEIKIYKFRGVLHFFGFFRDLK